MTDPSTTTRAQAVQRTFHVSELWVILRALGVVAPNVEAPPEIAAEADAAQVKLLKHGSLISDAAGRQRLAPGLDALVRPAAYPDTVLIATMTDHTASEPIAQEACFSWTPQALVINWVDDAQQHHFAAHNPLEVQAAVWDHLSSMCTLDVDEPDPAAPPLTSPDIEAGVAGLHQAVLLMAVNRLQAPEQTAQALSWWVSGRAAWILLKNEPGDPVQLSPVGRTGLERAVSAFVRRAIPS